MIKTFSPYIKEYRWQAILSPILMLIEVLADVYIPFVMRDIVNIGIMNNDTSVVINLGMRMIIAAMIAMVCGMISARVGAVAGYGFGANVRAGLFGKIQAFSFGNLDTFSVPSLITRLTNDCNNVSQAMMMALRLGVRAPAMFIFALIMAFQVDRELVKIFLVAIPILVAIITIIIIKANPRFRDMQVKVDDLNANVQEGLTNIREIKSFVREDHEKRKFKKSNDNLMHSAYRAISLVIISMPVAQLVIYGTIIALLWIGGQDLITGRLGPGDLISFLAYVAQIMMSLMMVTMVFLQFVRAKASADRIQDVLNTEVDLVNPVTPITEVADGSIQFKNVSFYYPGSENATLKNITFNIQPGEVVGILGATGSGKSSLLSLIPRLYDVSEGQVLVGGNDVRDYDLETLRDAVSIVLQQNTLFSGTIRENMHWGDEQASDEEIIEALKHAQAWEFVSKLADGLDHHVEQGGSNFSGGQKQRLCIARSLIKHPKVLILDDSTSAVDMDTDAKIRRSFANDYPNITKIIIAQRIASIENADHILVLDEGQVNAIGTAEELLETSTIYQEIYESQQRGVISE